MIFKKALLLFTLSVMSSGSVMAQSAMDLKNDSKTPGDVLTYGMGHDTTRFSPLNQINLDSVKKLRPVWTYSLADKRGQESQPLVYNGVMYVTTHNSTVALDAVTGRQVWKSMLKYPAETPRAACCGIVNRGAAIFEGKLYRTTLDAHVIALDIKTGKEVWRTKSIDFKTGYSMTVAPLIADGVVVTGISGGEYGIRGFIEGYDAKSGKKLWRTYTIPGKGEPGNDTWKDGGDAWKRGGAPTWLTGSYDADLKTVYWGTGNPASWNAKIRPGDNLYSASILALDPKTGKIKWHYQTSPNDPFDHDATNELILTELNGKKVLMQASRNGFFYILDRTNGKLIAANKFVEKLNWASKIDLKSGRPVVTDITKKARKGEEVTYWPSALGGKNWSPMSYNPTTKTAFANTLNIGMKYQAVEQKFRPGAFWFGAKFSWAWPEGSRGELRAIDPTTGKTKWKSSVDIPRLGGVLSTGGNLVFTGATTGEFEAFDANTGKKVWEYNTGSGIIGQPISWEKDGKQYITVLSGSGGVYALFSGDQRLANVPAGGSVWTFALGE